MRIHPWRLALLLLVFGLIPILYGQGISDSYRQAAQQWRQAAAKYTGANRQCALTQAQYYDCLAAMNGTCSQPTCSINSLAGSSSGSSSSSSPNYSGGSSGLGVPPNSSLGGYQALMNSGFDLLRGVLADRAADRERQEELQRQQEEQEEIEREERERREEIEAEENALRGVEEAEREARRIERQINKDAADLLGDSRELLDSTGCMDAPEASDCAAAYRPGARPGAPLPGLDEPVVDGSGIPSAINFNDILGPEPGLQDTPHGATFPDTPMMGALDQLANEAVPTPTVPQPLGRGGALQELSSDIGDSRSGRSPASRSALDDVIADMPGSDMAEPGDSNGYERMVKRGALSIGEKIISAEEGGAVAVETAHKYGDFIKDYKDAREAYEIGSRVVQGEATEADKERIRERIEEEFEDTAIVNPAAREIIRDNKKRIKEKSDEQQDILNNALEAAQTDDPDELAERFKYHEEKTSGGDVFGVKDIPLAGKRIAEIVDSYQKFRAALYGKTE
jgi:hypothetical protein